MRISHLSKLAGIGVTLIASLGLTLTPAMAEQGIGPDNSVNYMAKGNPSRPPNYVAGITPHAQERMAERGVSREQVIDAVAAPDRYLWSSENNTWNVTRGNLRIAINNNAWVVTVIKLR